MDQTLVEKFEMVGTLTGVQQDFSAPKGMLCANFTIVGIDGKRQIFQGETSQTEGFPRAEQVARSGQPNSVTVSGFEKDGNKYALNITVNSLG